VNGELPEGIAKKLVRVRLAGNAETPVEVGAGWNSPEVFKVTGVGSDASDPVLSQEKPLPVVKTD
jgi:hypothetical protein